MKWLFPILIYLLGNSLPAQEVIISPSAESGIYPAEFNLYLTSTVEGAIIRYTTTGLAPTNNDNIYDAQKGIVIEDRSNSENIFSSIPTVKNDWLPPKSEVTKGVIVWAQAFLNNLPIGEPGIFSYFININYSFPIVSLVGKKSDFFSDSLGILVPGDNYDSANNIPGNAGMRGRAWERPAQFELIQNKELVLRQNIGIRIHGLSTRSLPQKSLRLYARNDYGKKYFEYPFFPNSATQKFKRLILRSPDSDWSNTFFKDEMIHSLVKENLNMDVQDHLPCIVFINGEYWGIYNLRERQDEHHLSIKLDIDDDDINILEANANIVEGDNTDYLNLLQFVRANDLSITTNYEQVESWINIPNFIDYHITELFFANQDWPRNNYKYWQALEGDQRWRWLFFDCDFCMIFHHDDHLGIVMNNEIFETFNRDGEDFQEWSVIILRKLLANDNFRNAFIAQLFQTATGLFSTDNLISRIDSFENVYAPEIAEHMHRWRNMGNYGIWQSNVNDLRKFALQRPPYLMKKFQSYIGSPFTLSPNPTFHEVNISSAIDSDSPTELTVLNIHGQVIMTRSYSNVPEMSSQALDLSALSSGNYIVLIKYRNIQFPHFLTVL